MPVSVKQRLFPSHIDIPEAIRAKVIELLNLSLALNLDLKTQVKQAHWNIKGPEFYQLHLLFDELASELEESIDEFAERATTLGGTALGTIQMATQNTILPEYPYQTYEGIALVKALVERYGIFAKHLREAIDKTAEWGDTDTSDLYTQVSREVDKRLWFLEAHLQGE